MFLAGIDYSMNSPGICIYDRNKELLFKNCEFFVYSNTKVKLENFKNIFITPQKDFSCNEERFSFVSDWATEILSKYDVKITGLEGYSYGSKSNRIFDIGENGGVLKHKLWKLNIDIKIFTPGQVKKNFSGKGNSNKEFMYEALKISEKINLGNKSDSPISDIIDSYAVLKTLMKELNI
jgi:Holliday junction resolvasome RuvABC endonuclease subunit